MTLVSDDLTPPDLILKGSGDMAKIAVLIILGVRQPIEDAIDHIEKIYAASQLPAVFHLVTPMYQEFVEYLLDKG